MAEPEPPPEKIPAEESPPDPVASLALLRGIEEGFVPLGAPTETKEHPEDGRNPSFARHCWTELPMALDVPSAVKITALRIPTTTAISMCKQRIEEQVFLYCGWMKDMVFQAILEETYEAWASGASSVSFTAASLLSRILHGIAFAWRPSNSRNAADHQLRMASPGGKVAEWLEQQTAIVTTEENPYLYADANSVLEWVSRRGRPSVHTVNDTLEVLLVVEQLPQLSSLDRKILDELLGEAYKYRIVQIKNTYGLVAVKEEDAKRWAEQRHFQLESASIQKEAPTWIDQAKNKLPKPPEATIPQAVIEVAQSVGRRARASRTIYYGSDTTYGTPKQLQEAILKVITEQGFQTCRMLSDQLEVSIVRIKTALARLVWNRRQVMEYRVFETLQSHHVTTSYVNQLERTEGQLRRLVLDTLTAVPPHKLSVAGDDSDEVNAIPAEWLEDSHDWLQTRIVRPAILEHETMLLEYVITGYAPSVRNDDGELIQPTLFRATPEEDGPYVSLTEAQVWAGKHAYRERMKSNSEIHHPMAQANEISLISGTSNKSIFGRIVGHDSIEESDGAMEHRILILPNGENEAIWATLVGSTVCIVDEKEYSMRLSDYEKDSQAYRECLGIVKYIQRHANGGPFLLPVDPIALGVPNYHEVITNPMDVSTVLKKLQDGAYSNPPPVDRNPVVCMLRGPFRDDIGLIFGNAMTFNPPDDWIYQAALALKKQVMQKIDQICRSVSAEQQSVYIEDDFSDDELGIISGSRKRKRRTKEDQAGAVVAEAIRLDTLTKRIPVSPRVSDFSLDSAYWKCQCKSHSELDELRLLYQQRGENGRSRRTTRKQQTAEDPGIDLEYFFDDIRANNRLQVEIAQESRHERLVRVIQSTDAAYPNGLPPYLGRVVAGKWEIRQERLEEALKWVLRGLNASEHIVNEEGWISPNNVYYVDGQVEPFESFDRKPKKTADQQQESDEEVELSEYEKARKERVARNKERLQALGLA